MKKFLLLTAAALLSLGAMASNVIMTWPRGKVSQETALEEIFDSVGFDTVRCELKLIRLYDDDLGYRHYYFRQYLDDKAVADAFLMIHSKDGMAYYANGTIKQPSQVEQSSAALLRSADDSRGELVWIGRTMDDDAELVQAYKIIDYVRMAEVYIDAETGEEIREIPLFSNIAASGYTLYDGWQKMDAVYDGSKYILRDSTRNIITVDASKVDTSYLSDFMYAYDDSLVKIKGYKPHETTLERSKLVFDSTLMSCSDFAFDTAALSDSRLTKIYVTETPTVDSLNSRESEGWIAVGYEVSDALSNHIFLQKVRLEDTPFTIELSLPNVKGLKIVYIDGLSTKGIASVEIPSHLEATREFSIDPNLGYYFQTKFEGSYTISNYVDTLRASGVSVHWGMQKAYDFYLNVFGRKSYDGEGGPIYQFVNPPESTNFGGNMNAAARYSHFDGTLFINDSKYRWTYMEYGLGNGVHGYPFVELNVMAHEYTHLVTEYNGNGGLVYVGEPGALNESFSDIMAVSVEENTMGKTDYVIGAKVMSMKKYKNMRSMKEPKLSGNGDEMYYNHKGKQRIDICPDTYGAGPWWDPSITDKDHDNGGVHYNSGVQNKWYYLLNEGGSGTNDLGNAYEVSGIGIENGRQIAYRNLMTYLTPYADYKEARGGSIQAAIDLFGAKSDEHIAVENAWYAVGVGEAYDPTAIEENELPSADDKSSAEIFASEGIIYVSSPEATDVMIYATDGSILYSADNVSETEYPAPGKGVYIVRAGESVVKVSVK